MHGETVKFTLCSVRLHQPTSIVDTMLLR